MKTTPQRTSSFWILVVSAMVIWAIFRFYGRSHPLVPDSTPVPQTPPPSSSPTPTPEIKPILPTPSPIPSHQPEMRFRKGPKGLQKSVQSSLSTPSPSPSLSPHSQMAHLDFPSLEQVRQEVAADPHSTPYSLLQVADRLGARMDLAFQSEVEAHQLWGDLEECAEDLSKNPFLSIRVLCLSDAFLLQEHYPAFSRKFRSLYKHVEPETRRLFKNLGVIKELHSHNP